MLRRLRIVISAILFALITFYFLDFANILPEQFDVLTKIQFIPAVFSLSIFILLVLVIITLLFGRIYCSSICPMGIYQDVVNYLSRPFKSKKQRRFKYTKPKSILRWTVVGLCMLAYVLGFTFIIALVDPYSAYGRIAVSLFKPVYLAGNNLLENIFTSFNNFTFYKVEIFISSIFTLLIAISTFLLIGYLAWKHGRIWCNTICPVGTILGFLSKFSLLKIRIDQSKCNSCGLCTTKCKSSCIDTRNNYYIDHTRCVDCFNCLDSCKQHAISFSLPAKRKTENDTNLSKRRFLFAGITTAALAPKALQAKVTGDKSLAEHPITPPGSLSQEHLLAHCTSCHLCISKCPSKVLKPAFMEYGLGGIMQPVVTFEKGFCNYDCTICGEVCPNEAIKPLTVEEKHRTQIGYVVFYKEQCIVYKDETSCGACSEHCPTQAIAMVPYKDGLTIPKVDTDICVGCGGCEYVCPTIPRAVYVEGNSTHKEAKQFHDPEQKEIEIDGFGF